MKWAKLLLGKLTKGKKPMKPIIQIVIMFDPNNGKLSIQAPMQDQVMKNDTLIALSNAILQVVAFDHSAVLDPKRVVSPNLIPPSTFKPHVA